MAPTPNPGTTIFVGALVVWGIYRRVRRNIGLQPLRPVRSIISIIILSVVTVLLFSLSLQYPKLLLGIGGGLLLGAPLGLLGLKLTKFETTEAGHFYRPNMYIGIALSVLFIGRMLYRFWAVRHAADAPDSPPAFQSPLTYFIFGLVAGYYIVYQIGVLVHSHDKIKSGKNPLPPGNQN